MLPALDARKQEILRAVVRSYVETAEPVGSEALTHRSHLGVSSATIRTEMAALEEMGFLAQPHTSAGRIPTDHGYRAYVDSLATEHHLPANERIRLRRRLTTALRERERVPEEVARTLATATNYASLVTQSHPDRLVFKHLHFIPLESHQVVAVIVTNAGVMGGKTLELMEEVDAEELDHLSQIVSQQLAGHPLGEITDDLLTQIVEEAAWQQQAVRHVVQWLLQQMSTADRRVYIDGTANILTQPEFRDARAARPVLEALAQEEVVAKLLAPVPVQQVSVTIGSEHHIENLRGCSVVATTYLIGGRPVGSLGIVGPTRMPYARIISLVRYLAASLSDVLAEFS